MDGSEGPGCRVSVVGLRGAPDNPVQDVEKAIGAKGHQIEGINYSRDGSLAKKKKLWDDADRFKYFGKGPENLYRGSGS